MTTTSPDHHEAAQMLLPWYVAGTLDDADRALVDGHLAGCDMCRVELAEERSLAAALARDAAPATNDGWPALRGRIDATTVDHPLPLAVPAPRRSSRGGRWARPTRWFSEPRPLRWLVGAQFAALVAIGIVALQPAERTGAYHALGEAAPARSGNVLAMFRPDMTEAAMRHALTASGARLVDGPTSAGAYVLAVPGPGRARALASLRADAAVTTAEPIDREGEP